MAAILDLLKKLPIDFGQRYCRYKSKGKMIAMDLIKDGTGKKALDAGCYRGWFSLGLKRKKYDVYACDLHDGQGIPFVKYAQADLNKILPYEDNFFDLIISLEVLEHLDNPSFTISEFRRVLKKDGELILTTPNSYCLIFRLFSLFGLTPQKIQRPEHKHFFCVDDIKRLFPSEIGRASCRERV